MNSPASSNDDSLPESDATLEETPAEPSSVPPEGESAVSAPVPSDVPPESVSAPAPTDVPPEPISASVPSDVTLKPVSAPVPPEPVLVPAPPDMPSKPVFAATPPGAPPTPVSTKQRDGRIAAGWALLLAMVSIIFAGFSLWQAYDWHEQNKRLRDEIAERLKANNDAVIESRALAQRDYESLTAIQGKVVALESQIGKSEGHAKALESLYESFSRSQEDRLAAEVRQAVEFADQQLRYAGNIETALIALRGAQTRLEQNDHGQFSTLREALRKDIEKLGQPNTLDIPGTALRLEEVLKKIDKLPPAYSREIPAKESALKTAGEDGEGAANFVLRLASDIWADLRSLVRVERISAEAKSDSVLLAPEQSAFLRENVKIRLLTARLAMLARDGHSYAADLKQAREWIERFFDMANEDVKAVVEELRALETISVGFVRHELIDSASAVRRFQTRESPPTPSQPLPPQQPQSGTSISDQAAGENPVPPAQP